MSARRDIKCSVPRLLVGFLTLCLLAIMTPASVYPAAAQQATTVPRIGFLSAGTPAATLARRDALRQGLRDLGYVEWKNLVIEWRYADGKLDRLRDLAAELVRLKVDVIVTAAPSSTRAVREATSTTPIVMAGVGGDPVEAGFVASLARPGGNITGVTSLSPELSGKQLELLREIVPRLSRVAVLGTSPFGLQSYKRAEAPAAALRVQIQYLDVPGTGDIEAAFQEARKGRADAVLVLPSPVLESARREVADVAARNRLPTMYPFPEFVEAGGLVSYGVDISDLFRRAATYVDKILRGTKPADLPVELPTRFMLLINLKAANQIGVAIPSGVLARADKVIK